MDKVVGVDTYAPAKKDFYPELQALPTVGTAWKPDCEAILSLYPDVVFTYSTRPPEDYMDDFEGTDIAVIRFSFPIQDYISEISRLGYVFGEREKAAEVIDFHQGYMDLIDEKIEGLTEDEKPRVYLEWNPDYMTDIDRSLHQLCTADLSGTYPTVEAEWVIVQNPDMIVKFPFRSSAAHGYDVGDPSEMEEMRNGIMNRVGFEGITAVGNGDVYIVGQEIVGGPRTLATVAYMAKWFHPELFEDMDPQAIHQEYLTEFQGLDYDLNEHGVFVYPPLEEAS
jgi:iron complex transport system substrate-binding protein